MPHAWNDESDRLVAREAMVRAVWARGVRDRRVLEAMLEVPHDVFASGAFGQRAANDDQTSRRPYVVARVLETLELTPSDRVLEIGTGSGYQAALLGAMCADVVTVESVPELAHAAHERLQDLGCRNVRVAVGDGSRGVSELGPYDAIVVAPGAPNVLSALLAQLNPGGYLVIPEGDGEASVLRRYSQRHHEYADTPLVWCAFIPLVASNRSRATGESRQSRARCGASRH